MFPAVKEPLVSATQKMIGRRCAEGPGGRDCACCGQAPGKARTMARRTRKRSERAAWKRSLREETRP